jgi:hypothetical protein
MVAESNTVTKVVTTYSRTTETTCPPDGNPGQTTGGGAHIVHKIIEGLNLQIAGLHEVKKALEELSGKRGEEILELLKTVGVGE